MTVQQIINIGKLLYERNLTVSTSGNISIKTPEGIFITGTGTSLGNLSEKDIVSVDFDGNEITEGKASSETKLHTAIYKQRPDINAIIHTHPVYLTSFAVCGKTLNEPIMSENILYFEEIPIAEYAMPSSLKLVENVLKHSDKKDVILMANHGVISLSDKIFTAFEKLETAEYYAHVLINTKIIGNPVYLSDDEINDLKQLKKKLHKA